MKIYQVKGQYFSEVAGEWVDYSDDDYFVDKAKAERRRNFLDKKLPEVTWIVKAIKVKE